MLHLGVDSSSPLNHGGEFLDGESPCDHKYDFEEYSTADSVCAVTTRSRRRNREKSYFALLLGSKVTRTKSAIKSSSDERCKSSLFVWEVAWFLGMFGLNTAGDISKFTKISRAAKLRVKSWKFWNITSRHLSQIPETVLIFAFTTRNVQQCNGKCNFYM